jgi:hypothetical protein
MGKDGERLLNANIRGLEPNHACGGSIGNEPSGHAVAVGFPTSPAPIHIDDRPTGDIPEPKHN